jgi:hypothetical protein
MTLFRNQATWAPLTEPGAFFLTLADSAAIRSTVPEVSG